MQVAEEDFLIAEREVGDGAGADHRLCRFEGVGVLQCVFLEGDRGEFVGEAFADVLRGGTK